MLKDGRIKNADRLTNFLTYIAGMIKDGEVPASPVDGPMRE